MISTAVERAVQQFKKTSTYITDFNKTSTYVNHQSRAFGGGSTAYDRGTNLDGKRSIEEIHHMAISGTTSRRRISFKAC
jgi:hypothetical protein